VILDIAITEVLLTPIFAFWWLMGTAFFRRPREVVIIGMIMFFFVVFSLMHEPIPAIVLRSFAFLVSIALATLFANQRFRLQERYMQISKIIQSVPASVIVTDKLGTIIAASNAASNMLGEEYHPIVGHLFTDLFLSNYQPSAALKIYKEWLLRNDSFECDIRLSEDQKRAIPARIECSGSGGSRILVIIFKQTT